MDKKKVLGRGLDSLLPAARTSTVLPQVQAAAEPAKDAVREISVDLIEANPFQPRQRFDDVAIAELAASIEEQGVVQPILVRPIGERFQLIAGERRWRASIKAGKQTIPALVKQLSNEQALEWTIIENLQREDLSVIEQAMAFDRLSREFQLTQEQIAQKTGKDRTTIANYVRLLRLPPKVQLLLRDGGLTFGHARTLLALTSWEQMEHFADKAAYGPLTVRQLEEAIRLELIPELAERKPEKAEKPKDPNVKEAERHMQSALGCKVDIRDRGGKGKIVIQYATLEDFDRVVELLGGR